MCARHLIKPLMTVRMNESMRPALKEETDKVAIQCGGGGSLGEERTFRRDQGRLEGLPGGGDTGADFCRTLAVSQVNEVGRTFRRKE